jgi:glycosyltransferase involved in cell wall biosynthesis
MLIVYHNYSRIIEFAKDGTEVAVPKHKNVADGFEKLAELYPNELLIWCAEEVKSLLNVHQLETVFHHNGIMASYSPDTESGINKAVGYIDSTPFVKIHKEVAYPAWNMSALVGGVNTKVIENFSKEKHDEDNFEVYLSLMARKGMWQGLCCYSNPLLLKDRTISATKLNTASYTNLFRFIKFHYKTQWLFYLLLCLLFFEKKFPLGAFLKAFFSSKSDSGINLLEEIVINSKKETAEKTIDVLIPTIGRKKYLFDFLIDLKNQTQLPDRIIIIEQNPKDDSVSELDYLSDDWPFTIEHVFTHQSGACNARNIGLDMVASDWVFFADDDIRIAPDFIKKGLDYLYQYGQTATTFFCHQENEKPNFTYPLQWGNFGSGCSIVKAESLREIRFDMRYEFGFGEDGDLGIQLRNDGTDVFYFPKPDILHLKAPMGGFRTKPVLAWENEPIQPKPSPTVRLYQIKNLTIEQQRSEKIKLYINNYRHQPIKNPIRYIMMLNKQWKLSQKWATKLLEND